MAVNWTGKASLLAIQNLIKLSVLLWSQTLTVGPLTNFGFPLFCWWFCDSNGTSINVYLTEQSFISHKCTNCNWWYSRGPFEKSVKIESGKRPGTISKRNLFLCMLYNENNKIINQWKMIVLGFRLSYPYYFSVIHSDIHPFALYMIYIVYTHHLTFFI